MVLPATFPTEANSQGPGTRIPGSDALRRQTVLEGERVTPHRKNSTPLRLREKLLETAIQCLLIFQP